MSEAHRAGAHPAEAHPAEAHCTAHPELAATHGCDGCGRDLCEGCVSAGTHLLFCAHCGERALPLVGALAEAEIVPTARRKPEPYRSGSAGSGTAYVGLDDLGLLATRHVVVPAAVIAMVTALLFYLLELREVLFGVNSALKQIGFCFVAATVLIARYGKSGHDAARQETYTGCLALATLLAMMVRSGSIGSFVFHLLAIALVWRFATGITRGLSLEADESPRSPLYGLERLELEKALETEVGGRISRPKPRKGSDAHGNPSAPVARLALAALVAFALGEPLLASAPPIVGERAMAAVVVFLFATAVVLAAGSAIGTYTHTRRAGGLTSPYLVPGRVGAAALLAALALALAMAAPGVRFLGYGQLREATEAESRHSAQGRSSAGSEATAAPSTEGRKPEPAASERQMQQEAGGEKDGEGGKASPSESSSERSSASTPAAGPAGSLLSLLAGMGRWLLPIAAAILILAGLFLALRHAALLRSLLGLAAGRLRDFLAGLAARFRRRRSAAAPPRGDPFADLQGLAALPAREAVLAAYDRLLQAFAQAGHARFERQTPAEFLASLPGRLRHLEPPAADLTDLYLRTAYSPAEPPSGAARDAVAHLHTLAELTRRREAHAEGG